ncbi:hypothetical protein V2J09_009515, partial [Rumex salicifolius]
VYGSLEYPRSSHSPLALFSHDSPASRLPCYAQLPSSSFTDTMTFKEALENALSLEELFHMVVGSRNCDIKNKNLGLLKVALLAKQQSSKKKKLQFYMKIETLAAV